MTLITITNGNDPFIEIDLQSESGEWTATFLSDYSGRADGLMYLAGALSALTTTQGEHVRPSVATDALTAMIAATDAAEGLDDPGEIYQPAHALNGTQLGQLIMQALACPDGLTQAARHKAVDAAETMGSDHAQALYHWAVLVTKLA
jgi:hypothetical protein